MQNDIFLQRIPDTIYEKAVELLTNEYHFLNGAENGGRMRLANYFVGIKRTAAHQFVEFIKATMDSTKQHQFPDFSLPDGFAPQAATMIEYEQKGGFSFGSYDMAVTADGLRNIELQAIATYPITTTRLNFFIKSQLKLKDASVFANDEKTTWEDFRSLYRSIFGGNESTSTNIVLADRNLKSQKTSFEFFATQKELGLSIDIADISDISEQNGELYYRTESGKIQQINRFYNRVLPSEAIYEDNYPFNTERWNFRYDTPYKNLKFINHPCRLFEVSKHLLPYISHPFNPSAFELQQVASDFLEGKMEFEEYVWKHKVGAAGFSLILSPNKRILEELIEKNELQDYVVQRKVNYQIFRTDDGLDKIIELRFMTAHSLNKTIVVPMARIGHAEIQKDGSVVYKIHFGDNNKLGYGFAPVLIF